MQSIINLAVLLTTAPNLVQAYRCVPGMQDGDTGCEISGPLLPQPESTGVGLKLELGQFQDGEKLMPQPPCSDRVLNSKTGTNPYEAAGLDGCSAVPSKKRFEGNIVAKPPPQSQFRMPAIDTTETDVSMKEPVEVADEPTPPPAPQGPRKPFNCTSGPCLKKACRSLDDHSKSTNMVSFPVPSAHSSQMMALSRYDMDAPSKDASVDKQAGLMNLLQAGAGIPQVESKRKTFKMNQNSVEELTQEMNDNAEHRVRVHENSISKTSMSFGNLMNGRFDKARVTMSDQEW